MKQVFLVLSLALTLVSATMAAVVGYGFNASVASTVTTYYGVTNQPVFWIKSDAQSYTAGNSVNVLVDSSGRGNGFGQTTAGKQPTFKSTGLNGLATMYFDGGDCLTNPSLSVSTYTLFIVTSNSAAGVLMEQSANAAINDGFFVYPTTSCSILRNLGVTSTSKDDLANWGVGKWVDIRVDYDGNNSGHLLTTNGVATSSILCVGALDPGTGASVGQINVGARDNATSTQLTGHISEFLLFSPALVGSSITTVQSNLHARYFP